ncbi:hypothetical protein T07_6574 [Trichinella nelsoni]|uniref:Uncharacterized protein n=1 Tax=Trichinella nelsoni TaxID=6336 RepID=A0A0V0RDP3_9BILA|nr:hypothetical protein T07_6574 [Trichinella nelsoni]
MLQGFPVKMDMPQLVTMFNEDTAGLSGKNRHASAGDNVQRKHGNNLHLRQGVNHVILIPHKDSNVHCKLFSNCVGLDT